MGFEFAEQLNWELPKNIFILLEAELIDRYVKAFNELKKLNWIDCDLPKMFAIQSSSCAPIVTAFEKGKIMQIHGQMLIH